MTSARLIVCERTSRWAVALRRELGAESGLVVETRSLDAAQRELEAAPRSALALEIAGPDVLRPLDFVLRAGREFPRTICLVLLDPGWSATADLWREAGALHVLTTTRAATAAVKLIRRHLAAAPPTEYANLPSAIFARLPWTRWATPAAAAAPRPS